MAFAKVNGIALAALLHLAPGTEALAASSKPSIQNDSGLKCAVGLMRAQAMEPETRTKALSSFPDLSARLSLFSAEAGNAAIASYKVKADAVVKMMIAYRVTYDPILAQSPSIELNRLNAECVPMLESAEANRTLPTLGQCAAFMRHAALGSMLQVGRNSASATPDPTEALVGALPGMLAAAQYGRMARQALVEQGKSPEQASKIMTDEANAVRADVKRAGDKKLFLAWDRSACDRKFAAFRAAHPLPAAPSK